MKKVIESGKKEFIAVCSKCSCKFSYGLVDICGGGLYCPECGGYIVHPRQDITPTVYDSMTVEDFNHLYSNYCNSQAHFCGGCKYISYTITNSTTGSQVPWCTINQEGTSDFALGCKHYKDKYAAE